MMMMKKKMCVGGRGSRGNAAPLLSRRRGNEEKKRNTAPKGKRRSRGCTFSSRGARATAFCACVPTVLISARAPGTDNGLDDDEGFFLFLKSFFGVLLFAFVVVVLACSVSCSTC
jgi:hypothetical protein